MLGHIVQQGDFLITTDRNKVDIKRVVEFLAQSYWANTRPHDVIIRSIENSLCFSLYNKDRQIGFARVVTDYATFAYLCDVFIDEAQRGQGLGKWLVQCITAHPKLTGLKRCLLVTKDAHGLYQQFGFKELTHPEGFLEILNA